MGRIRNTPVFLVAVGLLLGPAHAGARRQGPMNLLHLGDGTNFASLKYGCDVTGVATMSHGRFVDEALI